MQDWPWLDILGIAAAAIALLIALRANAHSKQANVIAERSMQVTKLPSVEQLHTEFGQLVPKLRQSPHGRIRHLDMLAARARLIARESLGPPFEPLRVTLQQLPPSRGNQPVGEDDWAAVQECVDDVFKAFEEFINR